MAQQVIITTPENSGDGTPLATAFNYCNSNFSELYSRVQAPPPATLVGSAGDQAGMYSYDPTYFYYCFADYDGTSTIWAQVQQAGNISATQIQYGNTIVDIASPGANVTFTVAGLPNRIIVTSNLTAFNSNAVFNSNVITFGNTFSNSIVSAGNIFAEGYVSANGNVRGSNVYANLLVHTGGNMSAAGNITAGGYFLGDGSQLTGVNLANGTSSLSIPSANSNIIANVGGATIATVTSAGLAITGGIGASGNISGAYILGNGSQLSGLPATYANSNVAGYLSSGTVSTDIKTTALISATGNILTAGQISAVGNIVTDGYFVGTFVGNVTGNFVVPGANTQIIFNTNGNADAVGGFTFDTNGPNLLTVLGTISAQANVIAGNVRTVSVSASGNIVGANISTTGNVTANYFIGSGSQLTGLYANANVAAYLPTYSGNIGAALVSATGNVIGGNIRTTGSISAAGNIFSSGTFGAVSYSASGNITGANLNATSAVVAVGNVTGSNLLTGGYVLATGNVTGANFLSLGLVSVGGNATAGNINTAGLITAGGNVTGANLRTAGSITATGNISGNYIIGDGGLLSNITVGAGSAIENGNSSVAIGQANSNVTISVNSTSNVVVVSNTSIVVSGVISASGNITTAGLITATGNVTAGNITTAGLITATGNVSAGNVLTTGSITATGNVTAGNITTAGVLTVNSDNAATAIVNGGANSVGNIGSSTTYFNTLFATASKALYADLAENYTADAEYEPGTVVSFDGTAEITQCNTDMCATVAGVISTRPAYTMNSGIEGTVATVALVGRVPCRVKGPVKRGAMMVSAGDGHARAEATPAMGTVIGKALQSFDGESGTIEIVVGRL
jgi:hypothetical protein